MTLEEVKRIIETRMTAEDGNGNYTEKSLLFEIHKLLNELEKRRESE